MTKAMVVAQAVAHRTTDREVPGSNPAGSWAFFSLSLLFPIFQSVVRPKFLAMPSSGEMGVKKGTQPLISPHMFNS